ncbi:MAG: DUF5688 family protein [Lachnospiraceae bacterium]|nr:DUF5688 family protein [Lachnospiraceae bacterium]
MGMSFEEFTENVKASIRDALPEKYQDAAVDIGTMEKINATYTALFVRPEGENYAFAINLDLYYEDFAAGEKSFEETIRDMSGKIQGNEQPSVDMSLFRDYEAAKERFYIRVCGAEQNQDLLERVPHQKVEDMAITYHLLIFENENGTSSAMITNNLMQAYGISQEQLHQDAMENSQEIFKPRLFSVFDVVADHIREMMIEAGVSEKMADKMIESYRETEHMPLLGLTNEKGLNGAGVMFYPDMMDKIGQELGSDFIVIPSSTHEMLFMADNGLASADELKDIVSEINRKVVGQAERLTNESYHYDRKNQIFEKFSSYEARMMATEKVENMGLESQKPDMVKAVQPKTEARSERTSTREQPVKNERKSVLKRLEQKKSEIKAREAGKEKAQGKRKNAALE